MPGGRPPSAAQGALLAPPSSAETNPDPQHSTPSPPTARHPRHAPAKPHAVPGTPARADRGSQVGLPRASRRLSQASPKLAVQGEFPGSGPGRQPKMEVNARHRITPALFSSPVLPGTVLWTPAVPAPSLPTPRIQSYLPAQAQLLPSSRGSHPSLPCPGPQVPLSPGAISMASPRGGSCSLAHSTGAGGPGADQPNTHSNPQLASEPHNPSPPGEPKALACCSWIVTAPLAGKHKAPA